MESLGTLSAFEDVQALLKGKLGEFLIAERKLRSLAASPSISIRTRGNGLLAAHQMLEKEMTEAQAKIEKFQSGSWTFSDVIGLGDLGQRLLSHLKSVANLEREAGGVVPVGSATGMTPVAVGLLALVALGFVWTKRK